MIVVSDAARTVPVEPVAGDAVAGAARVARIPDHIGVRKEEPIAAGPEPGPEPEGVDG